MAYINDLGEHLKTYEEKKWKTLCGHTIKIFEHEYDDFNQQLKATVDRLNDVGQDKDKSKSKWQKTSNEKIKKYPSKQKVREKYFHSYFKYCVKVSYK